MTELYSKSQTVEIEKKLPNLINEAAKQKLQILEPTLDEFNSVMKVIKDFIIRKNRIIYGGFAKNQLIKIKNRNDIFYKEGIDTPDIEFFSPEPIKDLVEICNKLNDKKYKFVTGRNAQHDETFTVFVNFENYCDITYMPKILFNVLPTITIDRIKYTNPKIILIDSFRMFTDPLTAGWRWQKEFDRTKILYKHYKFNNIKGKIIENKDNDLKAVIYETLEKFIKNKKTLLLFNYFAYNYYVDILRNNEYKKINIPYLDVVSIDYKNDAKNIYTQLRNLYNNDIQLEEYYPFFQYTGYMSRILYKRKPLINIYHNNYKFIPYIESTNGYTICNFPYVLMNLLISELKFKVERNNSQSKNIQIMFSNLLLIRNKYLKKVNKTIIDDTPFREFQISCKGTTITQPRLYRLEMQKKRKEGKKISFIYDPNEPNSRKNIDKYKPNFDNTSGNIIRNEKNKKITFKKSFGNRNRTNRRATESKKKKKSKSKSKKR